MENRRKFRRLPADLVAECHYRSAQAAQLATIKSRLRNISLEGVELQVDDPPRIDTIVELSFHLGADGPLVDTVGIVRWSNLQEKRIGVQFIQVTTRDRSRIDDFMEQHKVETARTAALAMPSEPAAATVMHHDNTLTLTGDFGPPSYDAFSSCWQHVLASDQSDLAVDLSRATRLSSMGIGILVGAHMEAEQVGKRLVVVAPERFRRMLEIAKVDGTLNIAWAPEPEDGGPVIGLDADEDDAGGMSVESLLDMISDGDAPPADAPPADAPPDDDASDDDVIG